MEGTQPPAPEPHELDPSAADSPRQILAALIGAWLGLWGCAHAFTFYPWLLLPLLAAFWLGAVLRFQGAKMAMCTVVLWIAARVFLVNPLPPLDWGFVIDHKIIESANGHLLQNWGAGDLSSLLVALIAGMGVARVPRRGRHYLQFAFFLTLNAGLWCSLIDFNPAELGKFAAVTPKGYAHDHFLYQETWRRMKLGADYYTAASGAFESDLRGQGATVRPPLLYWLWNLLPLPPIVLFAAYLALATAGLGAGWAAARAIDPAGRRWALLVPWCLTPFYFYGGASAGYLFAEFWILPLGLGTVAFLFSNYRATALGAATLAFLGREFYGLLWLGTMFATAASQLSRARKVGLTLASLLLVAIYYAHHSQMSSLLLRSHGVIPRPPWESFAGNGWPSLKACLEYGLVLIPEGWVWETGGLILAGVGVVSFWKEADWERRVLLAACLGYWPVFLVIGHASIVVEGLAHYTPDYWGIILLLGWLPSVSLGLARLAGSDQEGSL